MADQGRDESPPPRPELWNPQVKAVLAIWIGVTLVLIATYVIVLVALS